MLDREKVVLDLREERRCAEEQLRVLLLETTRALRALQESQEPPALPETTSRPVPPPRPWWKLWEKR